MLPSRYLDLLKGALLNEHHLEHELRLQYLMQCIRDGREPEGRVIADPAPHMGGRRERLERGRRGGSVAGEAETISFPYTAMGRRRLDHLERCLDGLREDGVEGDLVECGVGRAGGSIFMRGYLEAHELTEPTVWVVDRFRSREDGSERNLTAGLNAVRDGFARFELLDDRVRFLQGDPAEVASPPIERVALLRADASRLESVGAALAALYDSVAPGGFVIVDGWESAACREEVEAFRAERAIEEPLVRVDDHAIVWRRTSGVPAPPAPAAPSRSEIDLSVVVAVYNMRREAQRTLHALSRSYQEGIEDLDYEVIVIENGSAEDQRLGAELVASFGPEFRYLDLGEDAAPSPVPAMNRAIEAARGAVLALMIDGAHVLTPGVLRYAMQGIRAYAPAIVSTQQWYVGPGQQGEAIAEGYDADYEDRLFHRVAWPVDGYRLFEIGQFIGGRDWFDGMWESNCLFAPRELLRQSGGFDESFSMPGGGFANLDIYERLASTPGVNLVTILGEGSFHQVHGGTTTNLSDAATRNDLLAEYRRHYVGLRGRKFRLEGKPIHYVGSMTRAARRTHARRMGAPIFTDAARTIAADRRPEKPAPMPEELEREFTEAYWRSFAWRRTSWLGREVGRSPSDLLAYQEAIADAAPEWIVELRTEGPELAPFLASVCDLAGRGRVLTIGVDDTGADEHPRITRVAGEPTAAETVRRARATVGEPANALLLIGLAKAEWLQEAFAAYESLVPTGSFVILENTIMNGHPVWAGMGPGPAEAGARIRVRHPDFDLDPRLNGLPLSFNHVGYLRRVDRGRREPGPAP